MWIFQKLVPFFKLNRVEVIVQDLHIPADCSVISDCNPGSGIDCGSADPDMIPYMNISPGASGHNNCAAVQSDKV